MTKIWHDGAERVNFSAACRRSVRHLGFLKSLFVTRRTCAVSMCHGCDESCCDLLDADVAALSHEPGQLVFWADGTAGRSICASFNRPATTPVIVDWTDAAAALLSQRRVHHRNITHLICAGADHSYESGLDGDEHPHSPYTRLATDENIVSNIVSIHNLFS